MTENHHHSLPPALPMTWMEAYPRFYPASTRTQPNKLLVVWNPGANGGKAQHDGKVLEKFFAADKIGVLQTQLMTTEKGYEATVKKVSAAVQDLAKDHSKLKVVIAGGDGGTSNALHGVHRALSQMPESNVSVTLIPRGTAGDLGRNAGASSSISQAALKFHQSVDVPLHGVSVSLVPRQGASISRQVYHSFVMETVPEFFKSGNELRARFRERRLPDPKAGAYFLTGVPSGFKRAVFPGRDRGPKVDVTVAGQKVLKDYSVLGFGVAKEPRMGVLFGFPGLSQPMGDARASAGVLMFPRRQPDIKTLTNGLGILFSAVTRGSGSAFFPRQTLGIDSRVPQNLAGFVPLKPGQNFQFDLTQPKTSLINGDVVERPVRKVTGYVETKPIALSVTPDSFKASLELPRLLENHPKSSFAKAARQVYGGLGAKALQLGALPFLVNSACFLGMDAALNTLGVSEIHNPILRTTATIGGLAGLDWILKQGWKSFGAASLLKGGFHLFKGMAVMSGLSSIINPNATLDPAIEMMALSALTTFPSIYHHLLNNFVSQSFASGFKLTPAVVARSVLLAQRSAALMRVMGPIVSGAFILGWGLALIL